MATVDTNLADGIEYAEDPDTGRITYALIYFVNDLDPGDPVDLINQALSLVPARLAAGPIAGTYVVRREPIPFGATDCEVRVYFASPAPGSFLGDPPRIRVSTQAIQSETDFDAANRQLPIASRQIATVFYDPNSADTPDSPLKSNPRLPYYAARSVRTYTKRMNSDPQTLSEAYVARVNSDSWKGFAPHTLLCLEIVGDSDDGGSTFLVTFTFAVDKVEKFQVAARYVDQVTGQSPTLKDTQIQNGNGLKLFDVQYEAAYAGLPL